MSSLKTILQQPRYLSVAFIFAALNILTGTWAIYIPGIKSDLGISEAELGISIFFFALGVFLILPFSYRFIDKIGVGKSSFFGIISHALSFLIPFFAQDYFTLCLGMFLSGVTAGYTDISINTLVSEFEKKDKVYIMSSAHGFFSAGGIIGAGLGALLMEPVGSYRLHILLVVGSVILVNLFIARYYFNVRSEKQEFKSSFSFGLLKPLFALGLIGFVIMATEGAMVDWSALYLEEVCLATAGTIGLGYTLFSVFMTLGRFIGDGISSKIGPIKLIKIGSIIGFLSFILILSGNLGLSLIGFSLTGMGLSVIIPEIFRLGAKTKGVSSAHGISFVAGIGYVGFLIGPVILGIVASASSLWTSFLILLVFTSISFAMTFAIKK